MVIGKEDIPAIADDVMIQQRIQLSGLPPARKSDKLNVITILNMLNRKRGDDSFSGATLHSAGRRFIQQGDASFSKATMKRNNINHGDGLKLFVIMCSLIPCVFAFIKNV